MEMRKRKDPEPVISRLESLVEAIKEGKIKLPNFQRPYVWKKPDVLNLFDSIYRGYPIGSILLWNTTEKLSSERSILEALDIAEETESYQTEYLLDGQQRLTTVCGALYWTEKSTKSKWNVCFNLETEEFEYTDNRDLPNYFPLNKIIETRSFLKECLKFERHENADLFYTRAENLLKSIKDYKLAVVRIGDMKLQEVAPVFERINSKGRVLTMLDLMRAATWRDGFDLTAEINKISSSVKENGFGDISADLVLKAISVCSERGYNKADIDDLRSLSRQELLDASRSAGENLIKAMNLLKKVANIQDESLIPYYQQLILLMEICRIRSEIDESTEREIRSWFWITSIDRYFSGASTGFNNRSLLDVRSYARGEVSQLIKLSELDITEFLFDKFNLRNALSTATAALLSSRVKDSDIMGHPVNLEEVTKNKDFFKSLNSSSKEASSNCCHFFCRGKKDIDIYSVKDLSEKILQENFLNSSCVTSLMNRDLESFKLERAKIIKEYLQSMINIKIIFEG